MASLTKRELLNKVPEVTVYFWLIKVLCTTIGETAADYLSDQLHFGLGGTTVVMGSLLAVALAFQFRAPRYKPSIYWLSVVLISIVGTLITDNLTDHLGVPLTLSTMVFSALLSLTFIAWYAVEKTLSVHSIVTLRREAFYWLAILFTFALGTAAGDLSAEKYALGYPVSVGIFAGLIALVAAVYYVTKPALAVACFWLAYILTRPLGASIGDLLSQDRSAGGLGLGTTGTSAIFLAAIVGLVVYLTVSKKDEITPRAGGAQE